ncbi:hypothetical protein Tco_1547654 [Tanacetum coccineum]
MTRLQANPELSSTILGVDVTDDTFAAKMVALVNSRRKALAEQQAKERRDRPLTQAQQRDYMRTFVKNQSSAKLKHSEVEDPSPSQDDMVEEVEVPSKVTTEAQKVDSSIKRIGTKRKLLGRKGLHVSTSSIPVEAGDPDAEHKLCFKYSSDEEADFGNDIFVPGYALVDWELLPTGLGTIHAIYRKDNSHKYFTTLKEILYFVDRQDLMTLYGLLIKYYQDKTTDGIGLLL